MAGSSGRRLPLWAAPTQIYHKKYVREPEDAACPGIPLIPVPGNSVFPLDKGKQELKLSITLIYDALYRMGFKANSTGFFYLSYSVYLCVCYPDDKMFSREWLYQKVGLRYHTHLRDIHQQVETIIIRAWKKDNKKIAKMAGQELEKRPSDMEIIWYLYQFVMAQYTM